jgi:hypothetical protein
MGVVDIRKAGTEAVLRSGPVATPVVTFEAVMATLAGMSSGGA